MGLAASQARYLFLTARMSDLELQEQQICQRRIDLSMQSGAKAAMFEKTMQVITNGSNNTAAGSKDATGSSSYDNVNFSYTSDSTEQQNRVSNAEALYNADEANFQALDKSLELQEKNIETQHQAIQTEIDSVKKVIEKNIESSFKTFA